MYDYYIESTNGMKIKSIEDYMFYHCENLKELTGLYDKNQAENPGGGTDARSSNFLQCFRYLYRIKRLTFTPGQI